MEFEELQRVRSLSNAIHSYLIKPSSKINNKINYCGKTPLYGHLLNTNT